MTVWARLISLSRTKFSPLLRVCSVYVCCLLAYWSRGQSGIFWMGHNYSDIQSSGGVPFLFFASVVSDTVESGTIAILHGSRRRRKRSAMCWKGNLQTLIRDGVVGTWRRTSSSLNSQLVVPIRSQSVSLYLVLLLSNSCNALIVCYRQFHHRPAAILYLQLPRPLPWENSAALFTFIIPLRHCHWLVLMAIHCSIESQLSFIKGVGAWQFILLFGQRVDGEWRLSVNVSIVRFCCALFLIIKCIASMAMAIACAAV